MHSENRDTHSQDDTSDMAKAAQRELDDAKARLSQAADRVKHEAQNAGSTISALVLDELDRRAADMGSQIRAVAGRLRGETAGAEDEAASAMAAHAADLIDDMSSRLEGQSIREMGQRLGQFGRENPALFVMGCLVTGALAGRMIVATDTSSTRGKSNAGQRSGARGNSQSEMSHGGRSGHPQGGSRVTLATPQRTQEMLNDPMVSAPEGGRSQSNPGVVSGSSGPLGATRPGGAGTGSHD
ncbi:hypothetical protein [Pseudotabrizicola algicola]|uniref:Nutrient deprivation-induced protein n=1 Tax=Pseudotabrizicola algicola TaxID=2709381 RepID=A0A6B3RK96_9RHOB|nr:hypothetical protein [Pseudotabrizicola algicola]NEX46487.1 hypothetical protein [Pseudotabrizicola algicola]